MGLTGAYNSPLDDEAGIAVITHAFSRGITLFDTSNVYGPLTNEILLGKVRSHFPVLKSYGRELSFTDPRKTSPLPVRRR
jgi:aryl-alcohol dehydrogenase-like predicted oxidoreductase